MFRFLKWLLGRSDAPAPPAPRHEKMLVGLKERQKEEAASVPRRRRDIPLKRLFK